MRVKWQGNTEPFKRLTAFTERQPYDFSKIGHISLRLGGKWYHHGCCYYPRCPENPHNTFKITCCVGKHIYPYELQTFIRPIFHKDTKLVEEREDVEKLRDIEDEMTFLLGHELFHFLRKSKQISGYNTQSQANEFGFKFLREFKKENESDNNE